MIKCFPILYIAGGSWLSIVDYASRVSAACESANTYFMFNYDSSFCLKYIVNVFST